MVFKPLQKLDGNFHFRCVHNPPKKSSLKSSFLLNHIVAVSNSLSVLQFFFITLYLCYKIQPPVMPFMLNFQMNIERFERLKAKVEIPYWTLPKSFLLNICSFLG